MNSRAIIKQSIEFWTKKELAFEAYFNLKKIEDIIYLCEIITENRYNKKELILNLPNVVIQFMVMKFLGLCRLLAELKFTRRIVPTLRK